MLEEGPGVRILESCQGPPRPAQPERVTSFRFYGPSPSSLSDRSVTVRFVEAQAKAKALARWPKGAAVALLAALAALFWAAFWARRWWNQRRMKG